MLGKGGIASWEHSELCRGSGRAWGRLVSPNQAGVLAQDVELTHPEPGMKAGMLLGSPAEETVLSGSSWDRLHLLLAAPAVLSFAIFVGTGLSFEISVGTGLARAVAEQGSL